MRVCIDASFCGALVFPEPFTQAANRLVTQWMAAGASLIAPDLWVYEVTAIVRKRVRSGLVSVANSPATLDTFLSLPILLMRPPNLHRDALALANRHGLPATYDAHYLALAETERVPLWTADERLYRAVGRVLPWVRWVGEAGAGS